MERMSISTTIREKRGRTASIVCVFEGINSVNECTVMNQNVEIFCACMHACVCVKFGISHIFYVMFLMLKAVSIWSKNGFLFEYTLKYNLFL